MSIEIPIPDFVRESRLSHFGGEKKTKAYSASEATYLETGWTFVGISKR